MPLSSQDAQRLGAVRPELRALLLELMDAAGSTLGYTLAVAEDGGLRSRTQQAAIYADSVAQGGGTQTAYAAAAPGKSRHEYGAAFDVAIVAGGHSGDGTGDDDDYHELADLGQSLTTAPGLVAGFYFDSRGVGKHDPYHFQLNETLQQSIDAWRRLHPLSGMVGTALGFLVVGGLAIAAVARGTRG